VSIVEYLKEPRQVREKVEEDDEEKDEF